MSKILINVCKWLLRQAATLLLILAVLLGAAWLQGELKKADDLGQDRAALIARTEATLGQIAALKQSAAEQSKKSESVVQILASIRDRARVERQALWDGHFLTRNIPLSNAWKRISALDAEIALYQEAIDKAVRTRELSEKTLISLVALKERDTQQIKEQIGVVDRKLDQAFVVRLKTVIDRELPTALALLLGLLVFPVLIKIFFYYVLAPWASSRPAIRLLPSAIGGIASPSADDAAGRGRGKMSAVSLPVVLEEHQELLILPAYLQSTSLHAEKHTRWLLNASIPFSSLVSGMFMLTRVGPAGAEPVVLSATRDPLSEIGIIDLAEGAAFVCQPRSLAGVIQARRTPVRITRHWRLGSLQSWLTLQLRFLVFHGPAQLVVKGCRGIRIESPGQGRIINQAATLGFSAELAYANTRCETFMSYWTGKEDLFNDLFSGDSGVFVYEEMPDLNRATEIAGRGLRGFSDALLKAFGV